MIAITGTISAGKSRTAERLAQLMDCELVKADDLARRLMEPGQPGYQGVMDGFGSLYLDSYGRIDRRKLRLAIMDSDEARRKLEGIMFPLIKDQIDAARLSAAGDIIFEIPLLFEAGWQADFDLVIAVYTEQLTALKRLMKRDGVTKKQAERLLAMQMTSEQKAALADEVIDNSGLFRQTAGQLERLAENLCQARKHKKKAIRS